MDAHPNLVRSKIATAPSPADSGLSLAVTAGHGAKFADFPFNVSIWPDGEDADWTNTEIARVTGQTGDVLDIEREQEGTTARTILVGDNIAVTATAKTFADIEAALPGPQGAPGVQGSPGAAGPQGSQLQGAPGSTGPQGSQLQGAPGVQGAPGSTGPQGSPGSTGPQGSQLQGAPGPQGSPGSTGPQGSQLQGAPGSTGPQGSQLQGAPGVQGAPGGTGPQGSQLQGAPGVQGPQSGIQGSPGATGPQGSQLQGAPGAQGSPGVQGAPGAQGSQLQGAQGVQGPQSGVQGAQGTVVRIGCQTVGGQAYAGAQGLQQIAGLKLTSTGTGTFAYDAVVNFTVGAVTTGCQFGVQHTGAGGSLSGQIIGGITRVLTANNMQKTLLSAAGCQTLGITSGMQGVALLSGIVVAANDGDFAICASKITDSTLVVGIGSFVNLYKIS